eukprot:9582780-Alexandrium_andersonii.AAC.1
MRAGGGSSGRLRQRLHPRLNSVTKAPIRVTYASADGTHTHASGVCPRKPTAAQPVHNDMERG